MGGEKNLRGRHGIALVAVLLVLLSVMAAGFLRETSAETQVARNLVNGAQARVPADAGVYRAILSLRNPKEELKFGAETEKFLEDRAGIREALLSRPEIQAAFKERADLQIAELESAVDADVWRADGTIFVWPFGGGTVLISVQDEAGKVDLNLAPDDLIEGPFLALGAEPENTRLLVHAIASIRDEDDIARADGAEDLDYRAAGLAWEAKDAPFETVAELEQVIGMTRALHEQIAPYLTVHAKRRGRIDPTTAPAVVPRALPGADAGQIDSLLDARAKMRRGDGRRPADALKRQGLRWALAGPRFHNPRRSHHGERRRVRARGDRQADAGAKSTFSNSRLAPGHAGVRQLCRRGLTGARTRAELAGSTPAG